jgi:hypothetical protein
MKIIIVLCVKNIIHGRFLPLNFVLKIRNKRTF